MSMGRPQFESRDRLGELSDGFCALPLRPGLLHQRTADRFDLLVRLQV